jgi:hypothetical protein
MNDNLRNISLQYIKGDNYEKIICFHSEDIEEIKKILSEEDYSDDNYKFLKDILKIEKRDIGESLLDDLINYISLKDLKGPIEKGIDEKEKSMKEKKRKAIEANNDSSNKRNKLKKLITKLKEKVDDAINDENFENFNMKDLIDLLLNDIFKKLNKIYDIGSANSETESLLPSANAVADNVDNASQLVIGSPIKEVDINLNIVKYLDLLDTLLKETVDSSLKKTVDSSTDIDKEIKELINFLTSNIIKKIKSTNLQDTIEDRNREDLILLANFVINFLKILVEFELQNNNDEKEEKKSSIDNLENLIKIFKKYLYICENNIKKYERIFDYNEIGSIDEAFMIESYSKFLKKLHKLKQNLESKDTEKIKRELINSLDQFFNLHGFNKPENIDNPEDIKYIVQRILNYT